ncbi:MAG: DNA polymerase IV [Nitrosomonadales bacterium]|nr:DNA polymerase IV [Nitrosomonadales bacterium]
MPPPDWPNAIAHVDADCFYASCELLRRPDLKNIPVCVMSSQDACIVAKTYDAREAGITTGMTVWDARKLMPGATFLPADFRYYGQISDKLFSVLRRFSPAVEEYSIDEGFMDMNGLRALHRKPYRQIADNIREAVHQQVGVTVSVGVSATRTLAKMASEYNKPNGTTIVAGRRILEFLQRVSVRDIPGIGANREALLDKFGIRSGADFAAAGEHLIGRLLGRAGTDLWHELNGTPVYRVEPEAGLPKSVARTASMGQVTGDKATIHAHLIHHAMRLSGALMEKRITAKHLTVFLALKSFAKQAITSELPYPTADYFLLAKQAGKALDDMFDPGQRYRACGLIATGIAIRQAGNFDLFQQAEQRQEEKHLKLLETLHNVNQKFGSNTMTVCASLKLAGKGNHARFNYPMLECV